MENKPSTSKQIVRIDSCPQQIHSWSLDRFFHVVLQNDIVVCVKGIESDSIYYLAADRLNLSYGIDISPTPRRSKLRIKGPITAVQRSINRVKPIFRGYNIFGKGLEDTIRLEQQHHKYPMLNINKQYQLHLPHFLNESVRLIALHGLPRVHIFLKNGDPFTLQEIKRRISSGQKYYLRNHREVYEVSTLLKLYLRKIPGGLFTPFLEYNVLRAAKYELQKCVNFLSDMIQVLPLINREALFLILSLLYRIAKTDGNLVDSHQLAVEFAAVFFRSSYPDETKSIVISQVLITYFPDIFTLNPCHLFCMYEEINNRVPNKLHQLIGCRFNQNSSDHSDIPDAIRILHGQRRSFLCYQSRAVKEELESGNLPKATKAYKRPKICRPETVYEVVDEEHYRINGVYENIGRPAACSRSHQNEYENMPRQRKLEPRRDNFDFSQYQNWTGTRQVSSQQAGELKAADAQSQVIKNDVTIKIHDADSKNADVPPTEYRVEVIDKRNENSDIRPTEYKIDIIDEKKKQNDLNLNGEGTQHREEIIRVERYDYNISNGGEEPKPGDQADMKTIETKPNNEESGGIPDVLSVGRKKPNKEICRFNYAWSARLYGQKLNDLTSRAANASKIINDENKAGPSDAGNDEANNKQ